MEQLIKLYQSYFNENPHTVNSITGSGSDRRYFRMISDHGAAIGCAGTDRHENEAFINIDRAMASASIPVPEIYAVSDDGMAYLQQDLGDCSLFSLLHTPEAEGLIEETMKSLAEVQTCTAIDPVFFYPVKDMTPKHLLYDLNYFKYCFLKPAGIHFDEDALEADFMQLVERLGNGQFIGNVYRDCQSRNVMIHGRHPYWIDFQSMRRGPVLYDAASFLWQAKAGFSPDFRKRMTEVYLHALKERTGADASFFTPEKLIEMVLFRTLQVLGAYGLRGLTERKAHFVESIPGALANAGGLIAGGALTPYPALAYALKQCIANPRFRKAEKDDKLTVSVFSFSYKQGYPEDMSGNGGGFMFDCRALHNPGRYDQYKPLTGRDLPVIEFLEQQGEVQPFLDAAWRLTDPAVERYIKRGFSSLQIGFGCTGGRHRSVYSAERTARHLASRFGNSIIVKLIHREQNTEEYL